MPPLPRLVAAVLAVCLAALPACSAAGGTSSARAAGDGRLRVVTTVAPITSIAAQVGGDRVHVSGIVPEGTDSHTFEPPPSVAAALSEADLVLVNGLQLEDPTLELAEVTRPGDAEIIELGTTVLPERDHIYDSSFPRSGGKPNPHLWTDPTWAIRYAEVIRDAYAERDPEGRAAYEENTRRFVDIATRLSEALRADQESVPRRELLTYHDAYAYFGKTYGWTILGAIQPASFADPTPAEVARLIDQVRERRVPAIFGSEVFPSPVLEQIGHETGARYVDVLRDDDLPGAPGDPEHSWQGLMRFDFVTMIEALGGTAEQLRALDLRPAAPDRADYPQ